MKKELQNLLVKNPDFLVDGVLNKNKLAELARQYNPELLNLLMSDEEISNHFFSTLETGSLIFKKDVFLQFLNNKEFLPDSFTAYKTKIGLSTGDKYLSENNDVVLNFPYKDCILEGGQTKDDAKRQEVFFNETLAPTEINRLLDDKVLTNFKRYDKDGEHEVEELADTDNLIIKGNNLIALHSLKKRFAGKVKLIYIDPPYNTGNDSFKYNDKFSHSTWLTFMKNRLEIAKTLLADDGVIFVQCDDNEQAYLKILMDEIFERENFINMIIPEMSNASGNKIKHAIKGKKFPKLKEYIILYAKNKNQIKLTIPKQAKEKWDKEYNQIIPELTPQSFERIIELIEDKKINELDKLLNGLSLVSLSEFIKSNEKNIIDEWVSNHLSVISENKLTAEQINEQAISDWKWNNAYRIVASKPNKALRKKALKLDFKQPIQSLTNPSGDVKIILTDFNRETETARIELAFAEINSSIYIGDIWFKITTTGGVAQEGGVNFANGKKPEQLLKIILDCATKKGDIVLDYHLGSGTTAAVAHKMNRQYIGIEQMDYIETLAVERLKKVIKGEQGGISKAVNWTGGGSFVYAELKNDAQDFKNSIFEATTTEELLELFEIAKKSSFLSYRIDPKKLKKNEFEKLSLAEQKQILSEIIDNNNLYVNYSDIDDIDYGISAQDKKLNHAFYRKEQ